MMTTVSAESLRLIFSVETLSPEETRLKGSEFSHRLKPGDIVCVFGDLGAGKTTFIRGVCHGLEVFSPVTSPTFTLINEYRGRMPVYHFDFYRIEKPEEAEMLGLDDYFNGEGVCLIEWPERIRPLLPPERYEVHLQWDEGRGADCRRIELRGPA